MVYNSFIMKKYLEIKERILQDIRFGVLKEGERLPNRTALMRKYDVAGVTLGKALAELIGDNWLSARRKAGTFVSSGPVSRRIALVSSDGCTPVSESDFFKHGFLNYAILSELRGSAELIPPPEEGKAIDFISDYDVVVWPMPSGSVLDKLCRFGHKVLVVNRYSEGVNYISTDHRGAMREITTTFIERFGGNAALVFLDTPNNDFVWRERRQGFLDACAGHRRGHRILRMTGEFEADCSALMKLEFIAGAENVIVSPSSLFTGSVLRMAHERDLRAGKDFHYSDFDNFDSLTRTGIAIPSVLQDYRAMGREVVDAVRNLQSEPVRKFVPYRLINI